MTVGNWYAGWLAVVLVLLSSAAGADTPAQQPAPAGGDTGTMAGQRVKPADAHVQQALLVCDDSGTIWVCLPAVAEAQPAGLLDMDARHLSRNHALAQATATRTINTIAEVAEDYRFARFAGWMRSLNEQQQATYRQLDEWHEQYIENYHLDVRRTRDEVLG
ncbi:MAG TPA: hypothetical protein PKM88_09380, partial [bacterium]|nr:hypothetical protein [bacterium]